MWLGGWRHGRKKGRTDGRTDEWIRMDGWLVLVGRWTDRWILAWLDKPEAKLPSNVDFGKKV